VTHAPASSRQRRRRHPSGRNARLPARPSARSLPDPIGHIDEQIAHLVQQRRYLAAQRHTERVAAGTPAYRQGETIAATRLYVDRLGPYHGPEIAAAILRATDYPFGGRL
jgi:hypothetical protein